MNSSALTRSSLSREILRLAIPAALQNILQTAMFWVDTKMVARYARSISDDPDAQAVPLAALAVTGPLVWSLTVIATLTAVGTTAIVGRRIGEGRLDEARAIAGTACALSLVLGALVAIPGALFCVDWVQALLSVSDRDHDPRLVQDASAYFFWFAILFPFRSMAITLESALRGAGDTATPMIGGLIANGVNVATNALLIFGLFGLPRLGVEGAGIGVALASVGECIFLVWMMVSRRGLRLQIPLRDLFRWSRDRSRELFAVSLPALLDAVIFHAGFMIYQLAIYSLDDNQIAAHRVAITLQSAAFMPAAGFYAAAASLSGRLLGAGQVELATLAAKRTVVFGLVCMAPVMLLFLLGGHGLAAFFSEGNDTVAPLAAQCLMIGAFEVPFLLITESLRGTLRGAGETRQPVIITTVGTWLVRVPGSWLLASFFGLGLLGVWYTTVVDWIVRAGIAIALFRGGRWKTRKI